MSNRPTKAQIFYVNGIGQVSTRSSKPHLRKIAKRLARKYDLRAGIKR